MNIGIDKIGFYTPDQYVDMEKLAEKRGVEPAKYTIGIGQERMAVAPLHEDAVSMAANAALSILDEEDRKNIDLVLFGTESGVDHSKSGAVWVHHLTDIQENARSFELKQACYGATAGIKMAMGHIALNPEKKALILGADIAKYGLNTPGEPTQGAGAVAMVLSSNPRILALDNDSASLTKDISDFWRPLYSDYAFVDGKFSNEAYLSFLKD
ncbi:MAG: hydroxymethylglutaryl-CoA synthase, partial [Alkalibacterium sp.]